MIELVTWKNSELDASTSQEAYIVILEVLGDGSGKAKRNIFWSANITRRYESYESKIKTPQLRTSGTRNSCYSFIRLIFSASYLKL